MSKYDPYWGPGLRLKDGVKEPIQESKPLPALLPTALLDRRNSRTNDFSLSSLTTLPPIHAAGQSQSNAEPKKALVGETFQARHAKGIPVREMDASIQPNNGKTAKEYDVYAVPFVPSILRTINSIKAHVVATPLRHYIDYRSYFQTFAGTSFEPESILQDRGAESQLGTELDQLSNEVSYVDYVAALLSVERAAEEEENSAYTLYRTPLYQTQRNLDHHLWALSVPGLREDHPLIEMGDIVQIRQLWTDHAGHLPLFLEEYQPDQVAESAFINMCFNGIQYNGSVEGVSRAQEMIYLRVDNLELLHDGYMPFPMLVNAVLPIRTGRISSQRRALAAIGVQLNQRPLDCDGSEQGQLLTSKHDSKEVTDKRANEWMRQILFPTKDDGRMQTQLRKFPHRALFDHALNYEQAHAVNDICVNDYGTLPYLISGPPGTGKTKTLVEIAMQLLQTTTVAHILICAPSEAAADTLVMRLKTYLDTKQLLRLNRPGRADIEVPRELMPYCYLERDMFYLPPFKMLMAFNVVVTSCRDAAMLADARLSNNDLWTMEREMHAAFHPELPPASPSLHWGALLVDEAAQATEMDILPALSIVSPPSAHPPHLPQPRFVMAGDEHQLGPRTASPDPRVSQSLFARLSNRPLYKSHPLSRSNSKPSTGPPVLKKSMLPIIYPPFTNLIRNYRSHPAILSVPSTLFYNNTLIPEAPQPHTPLQTSPLWRGRKWPILFLSHTGHDEIERDGGGWYNLSEAQRACSLAHSLVYNSSVKQHDICIISPFAAQVKRLRSTIRSAAYGNGSGLWDVNIGPLEAFQGLEKRVVILCTTRTRARFLDSDAKRGAGVVGQPRRMNVALTRAKEALFVLGHPGVLGRDAHWRVWMAFCWRNGLVWDEEGLFEEVQAGFGEEEKKEKMGVLERALVAREEQGGGEGGRVLGKGVSVEEGREGYEAWVESLREALDEQESEGAENDAADSDDDVEKGEGEAEGYGEEEDSGTYETDE